MIEILYKTIGVTVAGGFALDFILQQIASYRKVERTSWVLTRVADYAILVLLVATVVVSFVDTP